MNATPAVSQARLPSDPAQLSSAAPANSVNSGGKGADFVAALSKAGAKPSRKPTLGTAGSAPDGSQLPGAGNLAPPPTVAVGPNSATPDGAAINSIGVTATQPSASAGSTAADGVTAAEAKAAAEAEASAQAKAADQSVVGTSSAAPGSAKGIAGLAPGISFSVAALNVAGELGSQSVDNAAIVGAGSGSASPAAAAGAVAAPTTASPQRLAAAKAAVAERSTLAGGAGISVRAGLAAPGATDAAAAPNLKVTAGVDSPEFGQGIADRLSWMVDNNLSSAKLQVNPPQLGPIDVRITLQGDRAQVWLISHSAVTRDALQSSSPNLREMLGAQGFSQVSVDISQRNFQDRSAYSQPYERTAVATTGSAAAVSAVAASPPRLSIGAVDAYA